MGCPQNVTYCLYFCLGYIRAGKVYFYIHEKAPWVFNVQRSIPGQFNLSLLWPRIIQQVLTGVNNNPLAAVNKKGQNQTVLVLPAVYEYKFSMLLLQMQTFPHCTQDTCLVLRQESYCRIRCRHKFWRRGGRRLF